MTATIAPQVPTFAAALIVRGDVIELDGQPWRVVAGTTGPKTRKLELKHANFPNRKRTIRPRREAVLTVLAVLDR